MSNDGRFEIVYRPSEDDFIRRKKETFAQSEEPTTSWKKLKKFKKFGARATCNSKLSSGYVVEPNYKILETSSIGRILPSDNASIIVHGIGREAKCQQLKVNRTFRSDLLEKLKDISSEYNTKLPKPQHD